MYAKQFTVNLFWFVNPPQIVSILHLKKYVWLYNCHPVRLNLHEVAWWWSTHLYCQIYINNLSQIDCLILGPSAAKIKMVWPQVYPYFLLLWDLAWSQCCPKILLVRDNCNLVCRCMHLLFIVYSNKLAIYKHWFVKFIYYLLSILQ